MYYFEGQRRNVNILILDDLTPSLAAKKDRGEMADTIADTRRLFTKPQSINDAYGPPSNFLEIDVSNPETIGVGRGRYTTYEVRLKVSLQYQVLIALAFELAT